jgi:hypothetical protein
MNVFFADTFFFIALLSPRDSAHRRVAEFAARTTRMHLVTTTWVFTELADGLSKSVDRCWFRQLLDNFESNPNHEIVWPDESLFRRGVELYDARPDKQWSLTDCISFVVMQERGITDALTGDHHFEQAGFVALLKE